MSKRATDKAEIKDSDIRIAIWMLKQKKTKKSVCEHLGILYNTKKLDKIIQDFRDREQREKELRERAKKTPLTDSQKDLIVKEYLKGGTQSGIAKAHYISAARVKKVLIERNVPIRSRKKRAPAQTEHITQDLEVKFNKNDKVFFGEENCFAYIVEVYDEEYIEKWELGRQRYIETYPWNEKKSKFSEPKQGIHFEVYWELENGDRMKSDALINHLNSVKQKIIDTGRETYSIVTDGDYSYKKMFVERDKLFPVELG